VVDEGLRGDELRVAVGTAWGQAVGLRLDPAEAAGWRRATGAYLAWRWTGRFGPADGLEAIQRAPWQPWIAAPVEPLEEPVLDDGGEGGGLLLAMLSQRHDGGSGAFVRGLWQLTRQRTWDGIDLRADPDLWQALEHAVDQSGQQLEAQLEDFAVARWFLGARDGHAIFPALRGLPDAAAPTPLYEVALADLPEHTAASPELAPYGTVYALVDVRGHPARSRLRAWLRGEYGVEWAFSASHLDASGAELGRLSAPPRADDGRSYLPVELTPDTTHVMLAATNLSHRLPDADDPDPNARAVRMIFDLVQD
ncbi:MAG TPA: hypothetical protein RMI62_14240, partial [Polyangiaceae bacterium LLY-WYZ-15_(1-7)]|nr:hypothetical protein [Polyangiaceae bacterium LLY-WYZ-15_(1-7)]